MSVYPSLVKGMTIGFNLVVVFAEATEAKKASRVKGLSLDAVRRRKAVKPESEEEEEEGTRRK